MRDIVYKTCRKAPCTTRHSLFPACLKGMCYVIHTISLQMKRIKATDQMITQKGKDELHRSLQDPNMNRNFVNKI